MVGGRGPTFSPGTLVSAVAPGNGGGTLRGGGGFEPLPALLAAAGGADCGGGGFADSSESLRLLLGGGARDEGGGGLPSAGGGGLACFAEILTASECAASVGTAGCSLLVDLSFFLPNPKRPLMPPFLALTAASPSGTVRLVRPAAEAEAAPLSAGSTPRRTSSDRLGRASSCGLSFFFASAFAALPFLTTAISDLRTSCCSFGFT
mmetsp:Transcript_5617/g.9408  ORF Transcript_5617/g.9408 Transcript_5617/m.9408 type:complete len:206 (-) Transcript_5617:1085-1702(-)